MTAWVAPSKARSAGALAFVLALAACERGSDEQAGIRAATSESTALGSPAGHPPLSALRAPLSVAAQALLDSANVALRAKRYDAALRYYRAAAAAAPNHTAPLYGMHTVARAVGDSALADSTFARLYAISPPVTFSGARTGQGAAAPKP